MLHRGQSAGPAVGVPRTAEVVPHLTHVHVVRPHLSPSTSGVPVVERRFPRYSPRAVPRVAHLGRRGVRIVRSVGAASGGATGALAPRGTPVAIGRVALYRSVGARCSGRFVVVVHEGRRRIVGSVVRAIVAAVVQQRRRPVVARRIIVEISVGVVAVADERGRFVVVRRVGRNAHPRPAR